MVVNWIVPLDINGDGKTDIAVWGSDSNYQNVMQVWISTGAGFTTSAKNSMAKTTLAINPNTVNYIVNTCENVVVTTTTQWKFGQWKFGIAFTSSTNRAQCISTGAQKFERNLLVQDMNGDGLLDIIEVGDSYNPLTTVWLSDGSKFIQSDTTNLAQANSAPPYFIGDVNGDSKGDIIRVLTANNVATVTVSMSPKLGDLITSATNGLGQATTIGYQPLTNNAIYKNDLNDTDTTNDAVYPSKEQQDSTYVVESVTAPSGASQQYLSSNPSASTLSVTNYTYEGRREHLRGRGTLGFRVLKVTAPNGVVSTTYNKQDFPFTGSPYQVDVSQPNGWLLSQSLNSYAQVELGTSAFARYLGNKRYIAYSGLTSSYSYELDKKKSRTSPPPVIRPTPTATQKKSRSSPATVL